MDSGIPRAAPGNIGSANKTLVTIYCLVFNIFHIGLTNLQKYIRILFGKLSFSQFKLNFKVVAETSIYVCMNEYVYFQTVHKIFIVFRKNPLWNSAFVSHNVYLQIARTHHEVQHYVKRFINALLDFSVTAVLWQPKLDCLIHELGATSKN